MKCVTRLIGAISIVVLLASSTLASSQISSNIRQCQGDSCVPSWSGLLVVYVLDANGAPLQGAIVVRERPTGYGSGEKKASQVLTDWAGMVTMSLRGDEVCELRISAKGFREIVVRGISVTEGALLAVSVHLDVDSKQLLDVLELPTAE